MGKMLVFPIVRSTERFGLVELLEGGWPVDHPEEYPVAYGVPVIHEGQIWVAVENLSFWRIRQIHEGYKHYRSFTLSPCDAGRSTASPRLEGEYFFRKEYVPLPAFARSLRENALPLSQKMRVERLARRIATAHNVHPLYPAVSL